MPKDVTRYAFADSQRPDTAADVAELVRLNEEALSFKAAKQRNNQEEFKRYREMGAILNRLKPHFKHGEWDEWVENNFCKPLNLKKRMAQIYRNIDAHWDSLWPLICEGKISNINAARSFLSKRRLTRSSTAALPDSVSQLHAVFLRPITDGNITKEFFSRARRARNLYRERHATAPSPEPRVFVDSGAFSLRKIAAKREGQDTDALLHTFLEDYATFLRRHREVIGLYANLDVIGDSGKTQMHQTRLEHEFGLHPVPVVHFPDSPEYLECYIDAGHRHICLGNLVGSADRRARDEWVSACFQLIAAEFPDMDIRVHGFGVGSFALMQAQPWWSVDSTHWIQYAKRGQILVPPLQGTQFVFDMAPTKVNISDGMGAESKKALSDARKWLEHLSIEWEDAVDHHSGRVRANLQYYEMLQQSNPRIPRIFYSGTVDAANMPERIIGPQARIMPSFFDFWKPRQYGALNDRLERLRRSPSPTFNNG